METQIFFGGCEGLPDIRRGDALKAAFAKDTPSSKTALSALVWDIADRRMEALALTANEPAMENARDRQTRFGINCVAENGELVNVETSLNPRKREPARLERRAAKLFAGQGKGRRQDLRRPEAPEAVRVVKQRREATEIVFLRSKSSCRIPLGLSAPTLWVFGDCHCCASPAPPNIGNAPT